MFLGLENFDMIGEHDTNLIWFLRVKVEYNSILTKFVLTRISRLINMLYLCQSI